MPTDYSWTPEEIRALRHRSGLTQVELGDFVGASETTIRNWEAGRHPPKRKRYLRALATLDERQRGGVYATAQ